MCGDNAAAEEYGMRLADQMLEWFADPSANRYQDFSDGVLQVSCARYNLPSRPNTNTKPRDWAMGPDVQVLVIQRISSGSLGSGRFKELLKELEEANLPGLMIQSMEVGGRLMRHLDSRGHWELWDNGASRIRWQVTKLKDEPEAGPRILSERTPPIQDPPDLDMPSGGGIAQPPR